MDGSFCVFAELTVFPAQSTELKATSRNKASHAMDGAGRAAMDGSFCVFAPLTVFPVQSTEPKATPRSTSALNSRRCHKSKGPPS